MQEPPREQIRNALQMLLNAEAALDRIDLLGIEGKEIRNQLQGAEVRLFRALFQMGNGEGGAT